MDGKPRIFVVEDDDGVRAYFEALLTSKGCAVTVCSDGATAVALIKSGLQFEVIFSDYFMAGTDGRAVLEAARERIPTARRILMSANLVDAELRGLGQELNATVLVKPVPEALILEAITAKPSTSVHRVAPRPDTKRTAVTRRRYERVELLDSTFEGARLGAIGLVTHAVRGSLSNVSEVGMGATVKEALAIGTRLRVTAVLGGFNDTLSGDVEIRWCASEAVREEFVVGMEFLTMPRGQAVKIQQLRKVTQSAEYRQKQSTRFRETREARIHERETGMRIVQNPNT